MGVRRLNGRMHGEMACVGPMFSVKQQARGVQQFVASRVLYQQIVWAAPAQAACTADKAWQLIARLMFMGRWRSGAVLAYLGLKSLS